jgi:hypothetical protein
MRGWLAVLGAADARATKLLAERDDCLPSTPSCRRPLREAAERRLFEIGNAIADLYPRRPAPPAAS